jgi:putative heme-binding domain-containing protein
VRAEALRRLADPAAKDLLLKALESDDPFIQQAARQGLRHSVSIDGLVALAGVKTFSARQRLGLLLIVRDSGKPAARALVAESLADADPLIHFAAIEWVGEERLGEFRPQLLSGLGRSAVTKTVFEATLAALERLDDKVRGPREEVSGEEYIAALVSDRQTPARIVERGLRMLRPDHPALTLERLGWLMASRGSAVAIEAVRTLAQGSLPGRFVIMATVATDRNAPAALRAEAIAGLANDASGRREVLLELATGGQAVLRREALRSLRGAKLSAREIGLVRDANKGDGAAIELLDRLIGATTMPAVPAATDIDGWLALLQGPADIAAGERVFFHSKGPGCYRCHQEGGRGGRAGPDLSTLSAGMDRRRLVESILTPGKEIAPQYVAWNVATTDGTVFTGILLDQTPEGSLVFADAQGRLTKIKADLIAERKPLTTSIMPDQLALSMTVQEFRDVLAFLLGRK